MKENEAIWFVQATDLDRQIIVNINLVVTVQPDRSLTFKDVYREQADLPLKDAKYSQTWHSIFIIHELNGELENKLESFTYDFTNGQFIPFRVVILDSYRLKVSPFKITAYQIHDEVPLVIIALQDYGIMAFNIFTSDIVFVIDFKRYFEELGYIKFIYEDGLYISAIFLLSNFNIGILINGIGVQLIELQYHYSLDTAVYPIFLIDDDSDKLNKYLYSPHRLREGQTRAVNWVEINYQNFYLHLEFKNDFIIHYFAQSLKACYLATNIAQQSWEIVVFNYFNNNYSKEYLRIPLDFASTCYYFGVDHDSFNSDDLVKLYTFCLNPQNESFFYQIEMPLSPSAHFSVDRMKEFSSKASEIKIKIEAKALQSNITAEASVTLKVNIIGASSLGGLTGIVIIVVVVSLLYLADHLAVGRYSRRLQAKQELVKPQVQKREEFETLSDARDTHQVELAEIEFNETYQ